MIKQPVLHQSDDQRIAIGFSHGPDHVGRIGRVSEPVRLHKAPQSAFFLRPMPEKFIGMMPQDKPAFLMLKRGPVQAQKALGHGTEPFPRAPQGGKQRKTEETKP